MDFDVTIEIPKGERNKYEVDHKTGRIKLGARCQCDQPLVILEHYMRPPNIACYDDGVRIVRGVPVIRGTAR